MTSTIEMSKRVYSSEPTIRRYVGVVENISDTTVRVLGSNEVLDEITDSIHDCCKEMFEEMKKICGCDQGVAYKARVVFPLVLAKMTTIGNAVGGLDQVREGFAGLMDVATTIAEPILWFYAVTACVLMATGKKQIGWDKLKNVGYSYILMTMLPSLFQLCRAVAKMLMTCFAGL